MAIDRTKLKQIHNLLAQNGFAQDYSTFEKKFAGNANYGNRKKVYDLITENGGDIGGSYEDFMKRLQSKPKPKQQPSKPQTTAQRAMQIGGRQLPKPKNVPSNASPFVKSLYAKDMAERGEQQPTDYVSKREDYTSPKAVQNMSRRSQMAGRNAAKSAAKEIDKQYMQTQPVMNTGTPADEYVGKTERQLEKQMSDAADSLVASSGDFIKSNIDNEYRQATQQAYNEIKEAEKVNVPMMTPGMAVYNSHIVDKYMSPDKLMESLQKGITDNIGKILPQVEKQAKVLGVSPDEYLQRAVLPKMIDNAISQFRETEIARRMPKNEVEYFAQRAANSNVLARILTNLVTTKSSRQFNEEAMQRTDEGMNKNFKPGTALKVGADVFGMATDPVFGGAAKGGAMVAGKLVGSGAKTAAVMANGTLAQRLGIQAAQTVVGSGTTGLLFDSTSSVVQNFSTGEDTSLGNTLKVALGGGAKGALNFSIMGLTGLPLSQLGRGVGIKAGGSFWGNVGRATGKVSLEAGKTYMEGMGMYLGSYAVGKLEGAKDANGKPIEFDLFDGTLESLPTAIGFRVQHALGGLKGGRKNANGEDIGWLGSTVANVKEFLTSDKAKTSNMLMTEDERQQIFNSGAQNGVMRDGENIVSYAKRTKKNKLRYDDPRTYDDPAGKESIESDVEMMKNTYDQIMADPNVSWDAKAKFSAMVMGVMPDSRPMMDYCTFTTEKVGGDETGVKKYINEYSADGTLLSKTSYDNTDKREQALYKMAMTREGQRLWNVMGTLVGIDKNNYDYQNAFFTERVKDAKDGAEIQAFVDGMGTKGSAVEQEFTNWVLNNGSTMKAIDAFARESGMKKEDIVKLMNKDPLHRTEEEQLLCVKLRRELEKQAFPADKVHEEQSNLEGKDVADGNSLGTEEPNTGAVTENLDNLSKAEEGAEALMRDNDVFGDNFKKMQDEGMTNPQIYDWMIRNGGMTQEQLKPFADYINANARVQGMQQRTQQKIEEVVGKVVHDWSYRGTMNGAKTDGEQVLYVEDRDGRRLMVGSGDVAFDSVTGRAKEDVGDMLVCLDPETKELVYIKAEDAKFVGDQKPEDFANEYRQKLQEINSQPYNEAMQRQAERDAAKSQQEEVKEEKHIEDKQNTEGGNISDTQDFANETYSSDKLSEEKDEWGKPLVKASDGTVNYGEINEGYGLKAAPIRLSLGENKKNPETGKDEGYGLLHILARHGEQIRKAGYSSVEEFVESVAKGYTEIREGVQIGTTQTYLIVKKDGHANTLYIELSRDGKYWNVNSAGIFKEKYVNRKNEIKPEPTVGSSTSTDTTGVNHGHNEGAAVTSGNSPMISVDKDTNNSSNGNGNEGTLTHSDADYEKNDIPADKDGEPAYEQVPKERTVEDLFGKLGGDGNLAHSFAEAKVAEAEKEQKALLKKEPKMGTKINEYLKKKREYEEAVKAAEAKVAYWNDVKVEIEKLTHTTLDEMKEQQAELDGTAAAAEHKALYGEGQPADGIALAAKFVADAKITPDSFKKETGFGTAEQAGFVGMIAKEENGGKSIERLADDLVYYDNTEYNGTYFRNDTNEARNAIISALGAARTRKGLRELAQPDLAKFESERAQERDNAYHEAYGMDYEEYLAYSEQEMPHILEKINNFDEEKYLHDKAEEITNQIDKEHGKAIGRDESAGEEPVYGEGDKVLPGTRTDERGGGESPEEHAGRTEAERRSDTENATLPEEAPTGAGRVEEEQQKEVKPEEGKETGGETATRERMKVGIGVTYPVKVEDKPVRFEDLKAGDKFLDKNGYDYELKKWAKTDDGKTVAIVYGNGSEFVVSREITGAHDLLDLNDGKFDRIVSYDANPKQPLNPIERTARKEDERYQKGTDAKVPEKREVALRDAVIDRMKNNGMDVTVDHEEGQRVLDMVNGEDVARFQKVYHGSHADFVNFDHSHVGEGEGAQVYGWGTYVTEVKGIGKAYAHTKDGNVQRSIQERKDFIKQRKRDIKQMEDYEKYAKKIMKNRRNSEREWKAAKKAGDEKEMEFYKGLMDIADEQLKPENHAKLIESFHEDIAKAEAKIAELQKSIEGTHHLYTVDIPKDTGENYLDWNEPVTDRQIEGIRKYLSENYRKQKLEAFDASIAEVKDAPNADEVNAWTHRGENIYKTLKTLLGSDKDASMALSEIGLTGIKYPADNMRGGREDGKKNYVVFKEKDAKITDHVRFFRTSDGKAYGYTLGGKIYIDPRIANTETPIHEYAHLWASALRSGNEKEWQNVVGLMRDTKIWDDVKRLYPELKTDSDIADEVIAQYSGKRGAERLRKMADEVAPGDAMGKLEAHGVIAKVKLALDKFWKGVADMLHIHYTSAEEVADRVMKDLLDGVDPRELSGDKDGELKLSKEEDKKEDKDSSEKLFLSLQQKFNDKKEYYDTVDILSKRLSDGRADLYGLHGETEQATPSVVQAGIEIIARDRGGVSGAEGVRQENDARRNEVERAVEDWAKERGYWKEESQIKESSDGGEMYSKGSEANVYLSKDKQTITKVVDPYVRSKTELADFMENISVYNTLFPYSAYKVTGVTRRSDGKFSIVMEQPRIVGKQVDLQTYLHDGYFEKVKDYFESLGMEMLDDNISFTNGKYYVSDIHYGNVVFSKDGHPYVIDADAKYHGRFRRNNMDGKPFVVDKENDGLKTDNDKNDTEKLFLSLQNKKGKEYYDTVTEIARRVAEGREGTDSQTKGEVSSSDSERTNTERLRFSGVDSDAWRYERGLGSVSHSAATIIGLDTVRRDKEIQKQAAAEWETDQQRRKDAGLSDKYYGEEAAQRYISVRHSVILRSEISRRVKDWAKRNNAWFDFKDFERQFPVERKLGDGTELESDVYLSKDGKTVWKLIRPEELYDGYKPCALIGKLKELALENIAFGSNNRKVIGYTEASLTDLRIIIEQPYIKGKTVFETYGSDEKACWNYIDKMMSDAGFKMKEQTDDMEWDFGSHYYYKDGVVLRDVHSRNVIIDENGKGHVIDCIAEANQGQYKNMGIPVDKEKALTWLGALRTHRGTWLTEQELSSATNVVKDFDIEKRKSLNFRIGDNKTEKQNNSVATISEDAPVVVKHVDRVSKETGVKVNMVQSAEEVSSPRVKKALEEGKQVTGWYDEKTGEVHLYMPNIHDRYTAEKTIWHETVGHKGMRGLMGEQFDRFLRDVWYDLDKPENAELKKLVDEERRRNPLNIYDAIEEGIARLAEEGRGEPGFWRNIRNKVTDFFREIGYRIAPNTKDVKYLLWLSKNLQKNPDDVFYKMRAEAVRWRLDHESVPDVIEANGMFFDNDGKNREYVLDLSRKDFEQATDSMIHFRTSPATASKIEEYNRRLEGKIYSGKESTVDYMQSVQEYMETVSGKKNVARDIPSSCNPLQAENRSSSISQKKCEEYDRKYMTPLDDVFKKVISYVDGESCDFQKQNTELYMIMKHGLERNRVLFVRDRIEENLKDKIKSIKEAAEQQAEPKKWERTETEKSKKEAEILTKEWKQKFGELSKDLEDGKLQLDEYYGQMDEWIRSKIYKEYDSNKYDYSGLTDIIKNTEGWGSDADIIEKVKDVEKKINDGKNGLVKEFWAKKRAATDAVIDSEYDSGKIDKDSAAHFKSMFNWYVPLRKFNETTAEDVYGYITENGDPSQNIGSVIAKANGRQSLSDTNVMAQIFAMAKSSIISGEKNVVKQHFARFVEAYETGETKEKVFVEIHPWAERHVFDGKEVWEEVYPQVPEDTTQHEISDILQTFEDKMQAKKANGEAKLLTRRGSVGYKFQREKNKNEHIVEVYIAGKKRMYFCQGNPRASQAINGLLHDSGTSKGKLAAWISKWSSFINRTCAQLNTSYNPDFFSSNMVRDFTVSSAILVKEGPKYAKRFCREYYNNLKFLNGEDSYWKMLGKYNNDKIDESNTRQKYFKEFMDNGGQTGFVQLEKLERVIKEYNNLVKTGKRDADGWFARVLKKTGFIETANETFENIARYSCYVTSRESGRSIGRSIYDAKEVSGNFNRHGSGDAISTLKTANDSKSDVAFRNVVGFFNSYMKNHTMFYNAGVQGANMLFKNYKFAPVATAMSLGVMPFALNMAIAALNQFLMGVEDEKKRGGVKDPYAELPEWKRRNNINIYTFRGHFFSLPLGIELRAFYGLGDVALAHSFYDGLKSDTPIGYDILGQLAQLVPSSDFLGHHAPGDKTTDALEDVALAVTPTVLKPGGELLANRDWTGRPIYRDQTYLDMAPRWKRAYDSTNEAFVEVNKQANKWTADMPDATEDMKGSDAADFWTAPYEWQHMMEGYVGGMGATIGRVVKTGYAVGKSLKAGYNGENTIKDAYAEWEKFDKNQIPLYRNFIYTSTEGHDMQRTKSKWYNYTDELQQTKYNLDQLKTNTPDLKLNLENMAKKYKFSQSKEGQRFEIWNAANSYISKKKNLLKKTSNPEVIKSINNDINLKMQEAVRDLDKLSE